MAFRDELELISNPRCALEHSPPCRMQSFSLAPDLGIRSLMSFRISVQPLAVALAIAAFAHVSAAQAQSVPGTLQDFAWVDLSDCRKPKLKPPAVAPEDYEEYNFERRFLALEEGRPCIVMDSFIERLSGSASPGMRTLGTRKYRFEHGKWVYAPIAFGYFPYAIRRNQDGRTFYVEALLAEDLLDGSIGSLWSPQVYSWKGQESNRTTVTDASAIDWIQKPEGAVLQGLAVVLTQRLRSETSKPATQERAERERKRIRQLIETAWETLPPAERVAVDADGLPR